MSTFSNSTLCRRKASRSNISKEGPGRLVKENEAKMSLKVEWRRSGKSAPGPQHSPMVDKKRGQVWLDTVKEQEKGT
jgi:hypothetical protein